MTTGITADQLVEGVVTLFSSSVELNDSQIKSLQTAGIEIVPAPGDGKIVVPLYAILYKNFGAGGYSGAPTDYLTIGTGTDAAEEMSPLVVGNLGTGSGLYMLLPAQTSTVTADNFTAGDTCYNSLQPQP